MVGAVQMEKKGGQIVMFNKIKMFKNYLNLTNSTVKTGGLQMQAQLVLYLKKSK